MTVAAVAEAGEVHPEMTADPQCVEMTEEDLIAEMTVDLQCVVMTAAMTEMSAEVVEAGEVGPEAEMIVDHPCDVMIAAATTAAMMVASDVAAAVTVEAEMIAVEAAMIKVKTTGVQDLEDFHLHPVAVIAAMTAGVQEGVLGMTDPLEMIDLPGMKDPQGMMAPQSVHLSLINLNKVVKLMVGPLLSNVDKTCLYH